MSSIIRIGKRRLKKTVPLLLGTLILSMALVIHPASALLTNWVSTTSYPTEILGQTCVASSGFVYCMGGCAGGIPCSTTTAVNFASLTASRVGPWMSTTSYPVPVEDQSCVVDSGFVYCIGGAAVNVATPSSSVFVASLSASGVGSWSPTTSYPTGITGQSCVASSGFVYCMGGDSNVPGFSGTGPPVSAVYFAPLTPSGGVGTWMSTTSLPTTVTFESCVADSGFVYCMGGIAGDSPFQPLQASYVASLSPSGVGPWSFIAVSLPKGIAQQSCVVSSGVVYCIGGMTRDSPPSDSAVYFAPLSPSGGIGSWSSTTSYPTGVAAQSCVAGSGLGMSRLGLVYCTGGSTGQAPGTNAVYVAIARP